MTHKKRFSAYTITLVLAATLHLSYGQSCQMEGVTIWPVPVSEQIWDWYRGEITNRATTNIEGITSVSYGGGLNRGPYLNVSLTNSRFIMSTNAEYPMYEEYETSDTMSLTISFSCTGGTSNNLVFIITVMDSNNNSPRFRPSDELEFTVMPPLSPGYIVTGCLNNIIVRDIDLTTVRIDYDIEENPYFELAYDSSVSTAVKEFAGVLKTKTFIRSLPEPIILTIYATDVDGTNDPPLTNTTVIRITSNLGFEMPEEPVFSQTFYLATYTEDDQVTLQNPISLQQGYDELVRFNLEGVYVNYFELTRNDNQLALMVRTSLPSEILTERQIFLIVKAEREYTSGSSATIIIELPEDVSLGFERVHYTGSITDNNLILTQLILSQGYDRSNVSALVFGEHSSYFNAVVQGNAITVTMERLSENIISENNFIYLEIVASNGRTSARAVTTLEIVKDDNVTPVFNQAIYNGNYNPTSGFVVDQILIVQGFDDTVQLNLRGDYVNYFQIVQEGPAIDLTISALSTEIYSEGQIVLSIEASKPRTVGANAAIIITLPAARQLEFDSFTYRGTLQDNILILESIHLSSGYEESVNFELFGDYASYFNVTNVLNQAIVSLFAPLPNSIIENNNLIVLTINASDTNAVSTTASIVLDIIKDDTNTPVFNRNIYYASYTGSSIEIETINLIQGYDDSVTFRIDGVHAQYFAVSNTNNNVILSVQSPIPEDVIFNEKVLSFNVLAEKNLTVGGNAAVVISFPIELTDTVVMKFAQNTYIGTLTDDVLTMEDIILNVGYASGTEFRLAGDYSEYFILSHTNNVVSLTSSTTLPSEVIENNKFIVLEVEAQRERAVAVPTTVLIDIVKEDVIPLMFNQAYYRGVYTEETGLLFNEQISLSNGYDESVEFDLQGDYAIFFELVGSGNSLTLASVRPVTEDVLESHNQLLLTVIADRTNAFTGRSVISIDLPKENPEVTILRFTENSYMGSYDQGQLELPIITLLDSNFESYVAITGEHASYFNVSREANVINIELINELPMEVIDQNTIIILNLEAYYPNSISGNATIVIEIIKDSAPTTPVFDRAYYSGDYSSASGLLFEYTIQLVQGFDESVIFTLAGDDSQWFRLDHRGPNNLSLLVSNGEIQGIEDRTHLSFSIEANKPGSLSGNAAVIISLMDVSTVRILQFSQDFYTGTIENGSLIFDAMYLEGYASDITYSLRGDYANYFQLFNEAGIFTLNLGDNFPINDSSDVIILTLEAIVVNGIRAHATIIIDRVTNDDAVLGVVFEENYYVGSYSESDGLTFGAEIRLDGYATDISFSLSGDDSQWFELVQSGDTVTVIQSSTIPPSIVASNAQLIFVITAQRSGSSVASATIIITLTDGFNGEAILGFEQINYIGTIENQQVTIDPITLIQGFSSNVTFRLHGELEPYFSVTAISATVMIGLNSAIPETLLPSNGIIILDLQASAPQALTAYATIVFTIVTEEEQVDAIVELLFANTYYMGSYTASGSLVFEDAISLSQGYDESVVFALEGDQSQWFELITNENSATLRLVSPISSAIVASNQQLIFVVSAQGTRNSTARATIVITLEDVFTGDTILGFERINYQGTIENNEATLEPITLIQGFSANVTFALRGELESYFALSHAGGTVSIALRNAIPGELIPPNGIIVLELEATAPQALTAYATVVFTVITQESGIDSIIILEFADSYYTGSYSADGGFIFNSLISLSRGYDENVLFYLEGEQSQWFELNQSGNSLTLQLFATIPPSVVANYQKLLFVVTAQREGSISGRATVVISLLDDTQIGVDVYFEKNLYNGIVQNDIVQHESIKVRGFTGTNIEIVGEYASLFTAYVSEEVVVVQRSGLDAFPGEIPHVAIELHAGTAATVLILTVIHSGEVNSPLVTFSAPSYALRTDVIQTGLLGRVVATADNGEAVAYSLLLDNAHLQSRLSINSEGELYLSAPVNSGVYMFEVAATTVFTQATGTATIHLTVESLTVCGGDDLVVPPLIILDRDEEEPHRNLVVLDTTRHEGCWYSLTNRWPIDQNWLYVDDTGLHASSIDREHESIAFMALSQIQVELVLHCDTDNTVRSKRSLEQTRLGPYDYGNNKWVLTDTIQYNSRRSFVNLIVNDINDNAPIFVGKDQEPIAAGYPIPELIDTVVPRALAEVQATDADIGENAELLYWSNEPVLAVAPTTGFVHVRDGVQLEDGSRLAINATDRNGAGLTGSLDILVRLLDTSNIVVMTVQGAFLDDEKNITREISTNVGYEIKVLRSAVISADVENEPDNLRMKRDTDPSGASLQLYIYGLIVREPVSVERLTTDINNIAIASVSIISTVSLEDYLEGREICVIPGRDTGLLVATIILSILLFIILVLIGVWYFLKWRKENYDKFSDENSLTSRNESFGQLPKPVAAAKPWLNIEDLKKSERRLQEMLNAPIEEVTVEPSTSKNETPYESILDLPPPDSHVPIVIQSIDKLKDPEEDSDDDEFGEGNKARRKSVVTFNENVEKIIHVEDDEDTGSHLGYEIYKL